MNAPLSLFAAVAALGFAGCGQMDLTPEGNPSRVLAGEIEIGGDAVLPADAVVTVRVVVPTANGMPPDVLGSQTITNPGAAPIGFRVEYRAEDDLLRRGLNVEVRISVGGKIRYFNLNRYAVTLGNAADTLRISVDRAGS